MNTEQPLESSFETAGENVQRREMYSQRGFLDTEPDDSLTRHIFQAWRDGCHEGSPPLAAPFLDAHVLGSAHKDNLSLVDVINANPWKFVVKWHYEKFNDGTDRPFTNKQIVDLPCMMYARALMNEYVLVRESRQPLFQEIDQVILGRLHHYRRVILPLANSNSEICNLVVAVRTLDSMAALRRSTKAV